MSTTPKFCAECGTSLLQGAKFCPSCGAKVALPAATAEAPAPIATPAKAEPAAPAKSAAPAKTHAGHTHAKDAVHGTAGSDGFADPLASILGAKDDDHDHDHDHAHDHDELGKPAAHGVAEKRSLPLGLISVGALAAVLAGIAGYIVTNPERNAAFQCNILGKKDKCETDEARRAKIEEQEAQQENDLMGNRAGQFDLNFTPEDETSVLIVQKRYEEDRKSYVGRVTGSVPCKEQGDCPKNYECQGADKKEGDKTEPVKRCTAKDGKGDNRELKEKKIGDYALGKPDAAGLSKATIGFVTEDAWKGKHPVGSIQVVDTSAPPPPAPDPKAPAAPPPPPKMMTVPGPLTWWPQPAKKVTLPLTLANLPLLEKEQCAPVSAEKDAKCERLTFEKAKEVEKKRENPQKDAEGNAIDDPTAHIKTTDLSTYTYEVELSAPGYKTRKVLFYDDPSPPDVDVKKLEGEGWTVRKFKRTPDGKFVIDNASFDLVPEPKTLRNRYIVLLKGLACLKLSPDFKGKPEALKTDAIERFKEEQFFTKDKWDIAIQNDPDPEFIKMRDEELKNNKCAK
jgi:uncharacterized Zn finger protein (UPF0148 family)